ncbi:FAD-binding domain-containing protein [Thozetella sp. PMI_491]|nr:FAD-binding domain-containing protein [Thozetella sp. PMI_491]
MISSCIAAAALLSGLAAASNASTPIASLLPEATGFDPRTGSSGMVACEALKSAGLADRLLFPSDGGYEPQISTWFSLNGRLRPYCLVLPQSTEEVSTALAALANAGQGAGDWHIAVRSGGHASPGSNNIDRGVTIDLSNMNASSYDSEANVARIQPGGRWKNVYADLQEQGITVTGGRDGGVGVGGFLLGGGISFFTGHMGFGCDTVVNYEVVLANGTVVNANSTINTDLWQALKGGGSNFGIVTRYDMEAIASPTLYHEERILTADYSDAVINAVVGFANQNQSLADNHMFSLYMYNASTSPEPLLVNVYVNTQGSDNATTAFDDIKAVPAVANVSSLVNMAEAAAGSQIADGYRNGQSTIIFRADPEILRGCVQIYNEFLEALKVSLGASAFMPAMILQPFPSYLAGISQQKGGNMLGLDQLGENFVMWTGGVAVAGDEAAFALAEAEFNAMVARTKELSRSLQGDLDFIYMNYAGPNQDPLGSYGAANIQHMRDVAAQYDPTGVFQTRIPGGFKISRVV